MLSYFPCGGAPDAAADVPRCQFEFLFHRIHVAVVPLHLWSKQPQSFNVACSGDKARQATKLSYANQISSLHFCRCA